MAKRKGGRLVDGEWLPTGVHRKHGAYYLVRQNKWRRLGATYSEAMANYYAQQRAPSGAPTTVAGLLSSYIESREDLSDYTLADYTKWARHLTVVLGTISPAALLPTDVAEYLAFRRQSSKRQARGELQLLRAAYRYAMRRGWVVSSPAEQLERTEVPSTVSRQHLPTCGDVEIFWCHAPRVLQAYVSLKLVTGARMADLLALREEHIVEGELELRIRKTSGMQRLRIDEAFGDVLADVLALPRQNGWLFENRNGEPYLEGTGGTKPQVRAGWHSIWQRAKRRAAAAAEAAGVPFVPFIDADLRALVAKAANEKGGVERARARLGHTQHGTTDGYLRTRGITSMDAEV